jgi:serine/threonine-protein kinase ATR
LAIKEDKSGLLKKFIPDILKFAELLNNLCEKLPDLSNSNSKNTSSRRTNLKQMSLKKDFIELSRFFSSDIYSPILLPFNSLINVSLPTSVLKEGHNPFPSKDVFIERFDDCIELLNSLQRPKKIRVYGSDGKTYIILLKRGDDLRKDNGLIEFCNLMNRCFKRDPETRRRQLGVKTYLVVPLNDTNGIIEWIPGLSPYRGLVENQYRSVCVYDDIKNFVINNYPNRKLAKNERVRRFISDILPKFKPLVFCQWFVSNYSDPLSWFSARLAFTRSSAVFSIVGYLLGLGDRHGENIMIDETTGETVHVDFNCLFNKGEEFQVPERVPFRLTDNMVNAMGVTEFEGTFRKACEHTLRIARDNREAFMNFVTPFRFDHLYEWIRNKDTDNRSRHESLLTQVSIN